MPNPCRQRSFWARIKLSEKIFNPDLTIRILFRKEDFWLFWYVQCTNLLFFYYDFSSFIQNFQNLTRAHRTIQFFKEHADQTKKHAPQQKPNLLSGLPLSGHTLLKKYSKTRFRHLLFFFQSRSHGKHRKRSCRSWCCLIYHHFLLCQIIFQKKFKKIPIVYAHFLRIQYKQSANHTEFARCCICISFGI